MILDRINILNRICSSLLFYYTYEKLSICKRQYDPVKTYNEDYKLEFLTDYPAGSKVTELDYWRCFILATMSWFTVRSFLLSTLSSIPFNQLCSMYSKKFLSIFFYLYLSGDKREEWCWWSVSYTHLDVYKRQVCVCVRVCVRVRAHIAYLITADSGANIETIMPFKFIVAKTYWYLSFYTYIICYPASRL